VIPIMYVGIAGWNERRRGKGDAVPDTSEEASDEKPKLRPVEAAE